MIGNLTSQFFSNIYLDALDRFIVFDLGYKHYVRYVDDFCIVVPKSEKSQVLADATRIETLLNGLGLFLNPYKTKALESWQGVPFLGYVVRNNVVMPGKRIVKNFHNAARKVEMGVKDTDVLVSYLGMMKHYNAGKVCIDVFNRVGWDYSF